MTFEEWMAEVDKILADEIDLTSDDIPDQDWHGYYEDDTEPGAALIDLFGELGSSAFMRRAVLG